MSHHHSLTLQSYSAARRAVHCSCCCLGWPALYGSLTMVKHVDHFTTDATNCSKGKRAITASLEGIWVQGPVQFAALFAPPQCVGDLDLQNIRHHQILEQQLQFSPKSEMSFIQTSAAHWPPFTEQITFKILLFSCKVLHSLAPSYPKPPPTPSDALQDQTPGMWIQRLLHSCPSLRIALLTSIRD